MGRRVLAVMCGIALLNGVAYAGQGASAGGPPARPPVTTTQGPTNRPGMSGTGAISGVVTDAVTRRPIAGALVYLGIQGRGPVGNMSRQITDSKGRFVFTELPASDAFFMNVNKAGYSDGHYGDTGPLSSGVASGLIRLVEGQWFRDANMQMWPPSVIAGTVVDEFGEPMVGTHIRVLAKVLIAGVPHFAAGAMTRTDDRGRYRIAGLAPGSYVVNVPSVQSTVPVGTSALQIEGLTPETASRADSETPRRNNGAVAVGADHLLIIGNYATPPSASNGQWQAYPITFAPGVQTTAEATVIELRNGERRENVDLAMRAVPAVQVSGRVDAPVEAINGLVLKLIGPGLEDLGQGSEVATTLVGAGGQFTFINVPAGEYTLVASRSMLEYSYTPPRGSSYELPGTPGLVPGPGTFLGGIPAGPPGTRASGSHAAGDQNYWARMPVAVGAADVTGLNVSMRRAISLHGRVRFDGEGTPPGPTAIIAEPADGSAALGMQQSSSRPTVGADDQFTIAGLVSGEYVLRVVGLTPRQTVKSITAGGVDYATRRIDASAGQDLGDLTITYTDRIATITGSVQTDAAANGAARLLSVIAFPAARDQWTRYGLSAQRFKTVPVSNAGTYKIENIPAGEYLLVAVESGDARRWQDPAFLEAASKLATPIRVNWGDTPTQDLRPSVIK